MGENYYLNQIKHYQNLIDEKQRQLQEKRQQLEYLQELQRQHQNLAMEIQEHFERRKQRVQNTSLNVSQVKIFQTYQKGVFELLSGGENQAVFAEKERERENICRAIYKVDEEIEELKCQLSSYENMISDIYNKLEKERMG